MYKSTIPADKATLKLKFQPRSNSRSFASAYSEIPEEKTIITANEIALKQRVFSSKRSFRYSGTERAFEP